MTSANQTSTVLITGGSIGIGYEMARLYAQEDHNLVLVARNQVSLKKAKQTLEKDYQVNVTIFSEDLSISGAGKKIFDKIKKKKIEIDVLVNNAGFGVNGSFAESDLNKQLKMLDLNIRTLTELTWLYLQPMKQKNKGSIINVASTAGFQPGPFMAGYYASKAYVLHFTEALAEELKNTGIKVSAFCPGPTETEFFERAGMNMAFSSETLLSPVMTARKAALINHKKVKKGKTIIIPGFLNKMTAQSVRFSPRFIVRKIAAKINSLK